MYLRAALTREMEAYFGEDSRRIRHAHRVTDYAGELLRTEPADIAVVLAAAVLHDIGIHEAERKHGSAGGRFQEMEGPPIARRILEKLGQDGGLVDEVCEIIAHHHSPGKVKTVNFAVLYDADWLVNLADEYDVRDSARLRAIIDRVFLTPSGKALARREYLSQHGEGPVS
jgi:HD superfamily phosphodiesterase